MSFDRLRVFVEVAQRQHVTEAARALSLTQSAVSNAIAALEAEHQVRLFDRVGRGIVLNETGKSFLPEAKAVLARLAAADAVLADLNTLRRGRVTIFASQTIASYWLPRRLVTFQRDHPNIELDVRIGNTREVARAISVGEVEIGLVEGDVGDPDLLHTHIGIDQLVILVSRTHAWARHRGLKAADLAESPWILREPGSGTRSTLESLLRDVGVDPSYLKVALTLPSNEAVLAAVEAGGGATALSELLAGAALASGTVVKVAFPLPERPFRLLRHARRYRSRASDRFAEHIIASS